MLGGLEGVMDEGTGSERGRISRDSKIDGKGGEEA